MPRLSWRTVSETIDRDVVLGSAAAGDGDVREPSLEEIFLDYYGQAAA